MQVISNYRCHYSLMYGSCFVLKKFTCLLNSLRTLFFKFTILSLYRKYFILSILQAGANITTAIKVNPSSGINIANGWTHVIVTNLSATDAGFFNLFVKHGRSSYERFVSSKKKSPIPD